MSELTDFRTEKDEFFRRHPQSPLTPEQRRSFKGLNYFPENDALQLEVAVEPLTEQEPMQMQTSTGGVQEYTRYGRFRFQVEGQEAELTLYKADYGYFLPFVDSLAGKETYPAGRYLEPEELPGNHFLVDFNLAYNPACAFSEFYNCPIPPKSNTLTAAIRAGEMDAHYH